MKCRHCNKDLDENMICCPYCGTPVENAAQQPHDNPAHAEQPNGAVPNQPATVVQRKSNAFGITGFVVSLCFFFLSAIPGAGILFAAIPLIFSAIGLIMTYTKKQKSGLAIAGLSISGVAILIAISSTIGSMAVTTSAPESTSEPTAIVSGTAVPKPTATAKPTPAPTPDPVPIIDTVRLQEDYILDTITVSFSNPSPDKTIDGIKFSAKFYNSFDEPVGASLFMNDEESYILQDITIPPGTSSGEQDFSYSASTAVKAQVCVREVHFTDGSKIVVKDEQWVSSK